MGPTVTEHLDCKGMRCPMPLVAVSKAMRTLDMGQQLVVEADDPAFRTDIRAWAEQLGHALVEFTNGTVMRAVVEKRSARDGRLPVEPVPGCSTGVSPALAMLLDKLVAKEVDKRFSALEERVLVGAALPSSPAPSRTANRATLVVFSGEMDKLLASFMIATGAAAMGLQVSMFFTFWGLVALKKDTVYGKKSLLQKLLSAKLPSGPDGTGTSRLNWFGLGPRLLKKMMRDHQVEPLTGLIAKAREMDVSMVACRMSMDLLGITEDELIDGVTYGGVAAYLGDASNSRLSLFI
jgi:peroxiredoxin family protein/TusA-related sulfurtransferase